MKLAKYTMQISGPHYEKHKIRENLYNRKMILGPSEMENFLVEILQTNYIVGVHMGSASGKHKITENFNYRKNDTPRGAQKC